jgi:hypothetical protein
MFARFIFNPISKPTAIERYTQAGHPRQDVGTVIRYSRSGGADMPQLSSRPEVAESAEHADERLAKQFPFRMNRKADLNVALRFVIEQEAMRSGESLSDEQRFLLKTP